MTNNPGMEEGTQDPWDWQPWMVTANLQPAVAPHWSFNDDQPYEPGVSMLIDSAQVATRMGRTGIGARLLRRLLRPLKFSIKYRAADDKGWAVADVSVDWQ